MLRSLAISFLLVNCLQADDTVAATVNGEAIRLAEVDAMLARFRPDGLLTGAQTKRLREAVLDELVDEVLIKQHLAKTGPATDRQEIDKHMAALVAAQKQQGKTLADFVRETGLTETRLRDAFDTSIRFQKMVEARTSDAEYSKYFEANRDHFDGVTVTLSHILLRLSPSSSDGEIAATQEKLRVLRADLLARRIAFADAAKKYSLCVSGQRGGALGTIARRDGQVEEPVAAAAFALQVNEISEPVRSAEGMHLILVTKRTPGRATTYEKSREVVKEAYSDAARASLAAQLRSKADLRISLP